MEIGIFWIWEGRLLVDKKPWHEGDIRGEWRDSDAGHYDVWPEFQRQFPALAMLEYESLPRGRVLSSLDGTAAKVFSSRAVIDNEPFRTLLRSEFSLPTHTIFAADEHYEDPAIVFDDER